MAKWIKLTHNKRNGDPLLDTYINLDEATMIEYNHADDHFLISLSDSQDKVVVLRDQTDAYATIKTYLNVIDLQREQFKETLET
ncbi:MAG: hypothetical protein ACOCXZ_01620 [Chloroflexota bacterium]